MLAAVLAHGHSEAMQSRPWINAECYYGSTQIRENSGLITHTHTVTVPVMKLTARRSHGGPKLTQALMIKIEFRITQCAAWMAAAFFGSRAGCFQVASSCTALITRSVQSLDPERTVCDAGSTTATCLFGMHAALSTPLPGLLSPCLLLAQSRHLSRWPHDHLMGPR